MLTKYLKSAEKALNELNRIGYTEVTDMKIDYTPEYDEETQEASDYGILWILSNFDPEGKFSAVAYLYEDGKFELLKDNLPKNFKFKSLTDLVYSLNSGYIEINELPEAIKNSGWKQGDRDYVIAIDPEKNLMVSYNENEDKYLVEPYKSVEFIKLELMVQVKKMTEVEKVLETYIDLQEELSFLSIVREKVDDYLKTL